MDDYDWYDADGIDLGKISALAVGLHEVGHALGWNHTTVNNALMHPGGPDNCSFVSNDIDKIAFDDADTYRDRYPGLTDTTTSYGSSVICGN